MKGFKIEIIVPVPRCHNAAAAAAAAAGKLH